MKSNFNRTKIVATIGPASAEYKTLLSLIHKGVNVLRLNFSHGTYSDHEKVIQSIRKINQDTGSNAAILADLQGPKIRLGHVEDNTILHKGDECILTTRTCIGNNKCMHLVYPDFPKDVSKNDKILIDDGKIELKVLSSNNQDEVKLEVLIGGAVSSHKGVNLPDTKISLPSLTPKDIDDLQFALDHDVDWIALSFVRNANDIIELKKIIAQHWNSARVIAKIEKPQAVARIDEIIRETDGIMVARGDLGVEVPLEKVPMIQKDIVHQCNCASVPVIIATQMMESMIVNAGPTRAEITDVANAILDGADAVMLSGETAVGKYPLRVIRMINKIIMNIEREPVIYNNEHLPDQDSPTFQSDAICFNAARLSADVKASAIIGMTRSGYTAFMVSSHRPKASIYIFSDNKKILNTLSLVWGVKSFYYNKMVSTDETINDVQKILVEQGYLRKGDIVVNTAAMPLTRQGRTNMIKITRID